MYRGHWRDHPIQDDSILLGGKGDEKAVRRPILLQRQHWGLVVDAKRGRQSVDRFQPSILHLEEHFHIDEDDDEKDDKKVLHSIPIQTEKTLGRWRRVGRPI
jgi:hypothetical protein